MAAHHISDQQVPDADSRQESWQELMQAPIDIPPNHSTSFVVLADPTFHRVTDLLAGLDYAYPEAAKIGGFVSSATQTAKRALFCWSAGNSQSEDGIVKVHLCHIQYNLHTVGVTSARCLRPCALNCTQSSRMCHCKQSDQELTLRQRR